MANGSFTERPNRVSAIITNVSSFLKASSIIPGLDLAPWLPFSRYVLSRLPLRMLWHW